MKWSLDALFSLTEITLKIMPTYNYTLSLPYPLSSALLLIPSHPQGEHILYGYPLSSLNTIKKASREFTQHDAPAHDEPKESRN